ncbi:hypothetical protein [Nocardia jiangsuensis]|uniref:Uncharacterized protein n=1 Tax=Nocardia jiangsuensis TaxID=1691563 RepID=A0ABV8DXK2_9NOCA
MSEIAIECSFADVDLSVADDQCADLQDSLTTDASEVSATRVRDNALTQDFGATLLIALSTPSVVVVARELTKWLARRYDARLVLRRTDTEGRKREITLTGPVTARSERLIHEFLTD